MNTGASGTPLNNTAGKSLLNIAYGQEPAQRMDIYLPANRSEAVTKSLVLIHGGAWNSGSRKNFGAYVDSFHRRMPEYAVFNVDYRLISENVDFSMQEDDIKAAVDFITSHADTFKINPKRIVLLGVSAGGHLALLEAYKNHSPTVAAVIDFFGPTDLTTMYKHPWHPIIPGLLQTLLGGTPETNGDAYLNSSPVNFIMPESPPTLIFHGRQDYVVNISQSQMLEKKLQKDNVPVKLVVYDHAGHGWHGETLTDSFNKIEDFLGRYVP